MCVQSLNIVESKLLQLQTSGPLINGYLPSTACHGKTGPSSPCGFNFAINKITVQNRRHISSFCLQNLNDVE